MTLKSGKYAVKADKVVTHWPKPDKDGDGDEVWADQKDDAGNVLGSDIVTDTAGNTVRHYLPPAGFKNRPSFDHTDCYVRVTANGQIVRNRAGEAIGIAPGQTLVEYPDGTSTLLKDDYSRMLFEKAHDFLGDEVNDA